MAGESGQSTRPHDRRRRLVAVATVALIALVALSLPLLGGQGSWQPSGRPALQTHSVTLHNDSDYDGDFEWFVFGDYTNTVTTIGTIDSGDSTEVTLPADIETSYVFYMTIDGEPATGYLDSTVTEEGLSGLEYEYRFIEDNMGVMAVAPEDWPTPQYTPTAWDLTAVPTSTYEPNATP
jgi:hypothetical protein